MISKLLFVSSNDLPFALLSVKLFTYKPIVITLVYRSPACSVADTLVLQNLLDVLHNDLYQLVKELTRNNSILDLLLTSHPDLFKSISIQPSISNSDRDVVSFQFLSFNLSARSEQSSGSAFNFAKADFASINAALLNVSWAHVFANCVHNNQYWENFYAVIENTTKTFVLLKKKCTTISNKRLPRHILRLLYRKAYAWRRSKLIPSADDI